MAWMGGKMQRIYICPFDFTHFFHCLCCYCGRFNSSALFFFRSIILFTHFCLHHFRMHTPIKSLCIPRGIPCIGIAFRWSDLAGPIDQFRSFYILLLSHTHTHTMFACLLACLTDRFASNSDSIWCIWHAHIRPKYVFAQKRDSNRLTVFCFALFILHVFLWIKYCGRTIFEPGFDWKLQYFFWLFLTLYDVYSYHKLSFSVWDIRIVVVDFSLLCFFLLLLLFFQKKKIHFGRFVSYRLSKSF